MSTSTLNLNFANVAGQNVGAGEGVFTQKVSGNTLQFKTLVAGSGIQLITGTTSITISAGTGGGGGSADGVVSGATLNGTTLELGRTEGLGDVTVDLAALSGGTGGTSNPSFGVANIIQLSDGSNGFSGDTHFQYFSDGVNSIGIGGFGSTNSGGGSTVLGNASCALGSLSVALGQSTKACGNGSFSVGGLSIASGCTSIAIGNQTVARGDYSIALGRLTNLGYGTGNIGIGYSASISDGSGIPTGTTVIGYNAFSCVSDVVVLGSNLCVTNSALTGSTVVKNLAIESTPLGSTVADRQILLRDEPTGKIFRAGAEGLILPSGTTAERLVYPGIGGTLRYNEDFGLVEVNTPYLNLSSQGYEFIGDAKESFVEYGGNWAGGVGNSTQSWNMNVMQTGDSIVTWRVEYMAYDSTNGYTKSQESVAVFFNNKGGGTSTQIGSQTDLYDITDDPSPTIVTLTVNSGSPAVQITQTGGVARDYDYNVKISFRFSTNRTFK